MTVPVAIVPAVILLAGLPFVPLPADSPAERPLSWLGARDAAVRSTARGELEEGLRHWRMAWALNPWSDETRTACASVEERLAADLLARGREDLASGARRKAWPPLRRAAELRGPSSGEARKILLREGERPYGARWLDPDAFVAEEKRQTRIAAGRRAALELGERFVLFRRGRLRVFSDSPALADARTRQGIFALLDSATGAYRRLFEPLLGDGGDTGAGLDVVVFARREDYLRWTEAPGTLGMFLPERRASCFFVEAVGEERFHDVLLHEVCHQMDAVILAMSRPPPWLQ